MRLRWLLPVPLLLFAGAVARRSLAALVRRRAPAPRLMVEAFITVRVLSSGAFWLAFGLLEQRW